MSNIISNIKIFRQTISTPKIVQSVESKIDTIRIENQNVASSQLDVLEDKIIEHISNGQKLLSDISSLKELLRVNSLLNTGISSTTLTIDDEYSESVRQRSETFLYKHLCDKYGNKNVKWLNAKSESGSPHDFELLNNEGRTIALIECKGTARDKPTFYLTSNEWSHFLKNKEIYQVYRIFNVDGEMSVFCIDNLLASILEGQVVPYLTRPEILKEGRVFLTILI